ncbi:hypothetical protein MKW92_010689 [Papaver armeniacum]|nr:hypothetical protein MKW92_010689 [Papaver armeniacum]
MGWGNIYKRRMKVFTVAVIIYLDYKTLQQRERWSSKTKRAALWEKTHERNAKRVLSLIVELEGLWVKLGQYLSTRADVLPQAYIVLLKQLQDSLPPRPVNEVFRTIQRELGKSVDDLFSEFVEAPLATASIAQVHRATLNDGRNVVVKVQHEGIKTVILEDLKNAKSIVDWIAWAEPQYDFNPMIDEWCKEAPKELDFNHEAENTRTVSKNLNYKGRRDNAAPGNAVDVLIPEVIQSSEKCLVLEYMDGIRLNDKESLDAFGVDKQKLLEEITCQGTPHRPILLDFGLTKKVSTSMKQGLAKMFLACCEGDHVALLSAFAEMGLRLRVDLPEQAMEVTNVFFRASTPASQALETIKSISDQRAKGMKVVQEKMKLNKKEASHFNPVDAFPGDAVIFMRVLNLLRGLSSIMDARIVYLDMMRPFAESVLQGTISRGPATNAEWIHETPVLSDVEGKLRQLLIKLGHEDKILGIQVCAYKDGKVIIDTAAGMLGKYDPRPVQPDSLFPVFSVTKGITAGLVHSLVDSGKLKLEENISTIWPVFGANGKDNIKVHHVLNHTSGLHNALANIMQENPLLLCEWDECLSRMAMSVPETEPGQQQLYHYLSFGWLCGGIIEHASGMKLQEVLEEKLIHPLNIEGEMYIGVPPGKLFSLRSSSIVTVDLILINVVYFTLSVFSGVESRLATLTVDLEDLKSLSDIGNRPDLPSSFQLQNLSQLVTALPMLFNSLNIRRAIIPAANGHCSARALARYYATLADGGMVPPPHAASSKDSLGSHPHIPKFPTAKKPKKKVTQIREVLFLKSLTKRTDQTRSSSDGSGSSRKSSETSKDDLETTTKVDRIFSNPKILDAFLGVGDYSNMVVPNGKFGLGFRRFDSIDGSISSFGHSGIGGSTGFCNNKHNFAIAVTLNKMSLGSVTRNIIQLVCSELNLPVPEEYSKRDEKGPDVQTLMIN